MKKAFVAVIIFFCTSQLFSQIKNDPTEVTDSIAKKISAAVDKEVLQLKTNLEKKKYSKEEIEFILDTARIELYYSKYMYIDYTTAGMANATYQATDKYDKLLNKYYQKLMTILKGQDKQVLTQSQRAWMTFRDNEIKLIETLTKDEYSGGGTVQILNYASQVFELTRKRVLEMYAHYQGTLPIE
jgi:uncharacterized protein YecT (DUF1311 family)